MTSSGFADNNYLFLDGRILEDEKHPLTGAVDLGWFEEGETIKVQMYLNGGFDLSSDAVVLRLLPAGFMR